MHRWLPLCLIFVLLVAFRVLGSAYPTQFPNFQPLSALFFCGALLACGRRGFLIPLAAWLLTYPLPAMFEGRTDHLAPHVLIVTLIGFWTAFMIGSYLRGKSVPALLAGSMAAAAAFHLITNGAAWIGSPLYPKTMAGLWQSLWAGPGSSPFGVSIPSWVFLRNMMAANILFTGLVILARFVPPVPLPAPLAGGSR